MVARTDSQLAHAVAMTLAKKWRRDYGEFLADAWLGVASARARGANDKLAMVAGLRGVITSIRRELGRAGTPRRRMTDTTERLTDTVAHPTADVETRKLDLWSETKWQRCTFPWRWRVLLFLYCFEGWSLKAAGEVVGMTLGGACAVISRMSDVMVLARAELAQRGV